MPAEVNGAGLDVDVHQVINNPALDVILNPVDQEAPAHVDDFDERKFPGDRQTSFSKSSPVSYLCPCNHRLRGFPAGYFQQGANRYRELNSSSVIATPPPAAVKRIKQDSQGTCSSPDRDQHHWDNRCRAHRCVCEQWRGWEVPAESGRTANPFQGTQQPGRSHRAYSILQSEPSSPFL